MAIRYRIDRSVLRFTDTITIYNKISSDEGNTWKRTVVNGVQWSDSYERINNAGRISVAYFASITFPYGTYEGLIIDAANEEDLIVYGEVNDEVSEAKGHRPSDILHKYSQSGLIKSVNDNTNRRLLKNLKVVVA